jgi:hypothetical protein
MAEAQASVGAAATLPTTGTTSSAADATRHGRATAPQPLKPKQAIRITKNRRKR